MPPRPLHRWKSFWFGVLVFSFLGWSWMASIEKPGGIAIGTPVLEAGMAYTGGSMVLFSSGPPGSFGIGLFSYPMAPEPTWFPSGIEAQYSRSHGVSETTHGTLPSGAQTISISCGFSSTHCHVRVAHWLLIPFFLLIWSGFLFYRYRRTERRAAGA
ncbi:hypothetical protein [Luteolibacter soli]|uniref:Uncharacterized protein n=1 Tax=Luteolibacter soli TaxID=3135280 RepID=A0ABU9B0V2_9BACT